MKGLWIQRAHLKKGALHRHLGVPQGKTIPLAKLKKVHNASVGAHISCGGKKVTVTPLLKRRVQFALNMRKIRR